MFNSIIYFLENAVSFYFFKVDLKGKYTYVNQLYKTQFVDFCTDFIGQNADMCVYIEDREIFHNGILECVQSSTKVVEVKYRKPALENFIHVKFNLFAIKDENDCVVEIGALGYDITEQTLQKKNIKQTERKLQAILDSSDEAFYFLDPNLFVLSFSNGAKNAAKSLLGIEMHEGLDFRKEMLLPGTENDFLAQFNNALTGNATTIESEMDFPNGRKVWYKLVMKPVYDEKNKLKGVAVSFNNIDIIKKNEKNLREIAWHQSHLVRKPLSNILGLVNLLNDANTTQQDQQQIIAMLKESAVELDDIVKEVVSKTALEK